MMITIFTPTYNRANLLKRLYESLSHQTCFDFEWLVIDDGSTDDTKLLFDSLSNDNFSIQYHYQRNAGKHIAINRAAYLAKGEWMIIVDSDDWLKSDAVEILKKWIITIQADTHICAIVSNRIYSDGSLAGSPCTYDVLDTDYLTYRTKYKFEGDKPSCLRTEIWKEFQFPEYIGEKFCTEALVLNRIAQKYVCRYVNENFYVTEYLPGGLLDTMSKQLLNSPHYSSIFYLEQSSLRGLSLRKKIASFYFYWKYYLRCPQRYEDITPNAEMKYIGFPIYCLCALVKGF